MDCRIVQILLLVIILLFLFSIIGCHYVKHRSKHKGINQLTM